MDKVDIIINNEKQKKQLWTEAIKELIPEFTEIERFNGELSVWISKDGNKRELFIYNIDSDLIYVRPKFDNFDIYNRLIEKDKTDYLVVLMRVYDKYIGE